MADMANRDVPSIVAESIMADYARFRAYTAARLRNDKKTDVDSKSFHKAGHGPERRCRKR